MQAPRKHAEGGGRGVGAELSPCLSLFQVMERLPREILQKIFVEIYFCWTALDA
jgi:hypothetical protein